MDRVYSIDAAAVVSDVIDGEAVMLHRVSGDYFSTDGIGCLIWEWIGQGQSRSSMLAMLNAKFAAEPAEIETAVNAFLADLLSHKLVQEVDQGGESMAEAAIESQSNPKVEFMRPVLHVYTDIRRMILLDPIHDVGKTGWPAPQATDEPT
jgi:hypothetical protein